MARRQHILVLCVAALLLAAGSSAADANAAAAAAAAAATPDTPQTSDKVASAQPASSVRVSEQTQREKAVGGSKAAASGAASKKAASPSPAPAAAAKEAGAGPAAPPVSGQAPPNFPGTVVATPVTPASPNDVQAATVFPGGITVPVDKASTPGQGSSAAGQDGTTIVSPAATPPPSAPDAAAAAPEGDASKIPKKKKKKKTGKAEGQTSTADSAAQDGATSSGGSATVADDAASPVAGPASSGGSAAIVVPQANTANAVSSGGSATVAGQQADNTAPPVANINSSGGSATAITPGQVPQAATTSVPAQASANPAASAGAGSYTSAKPATAAGQGSYSAVSKAASKSASASAAPAQAAEASGTAAGSASQSTVSQEQTIAAEANPVGTVYNGQGQVLQMGVTATAPIPARAKANPVVKNGQVAATDVSDRSAVALDRAAIMARTAPAPTSLQSRRLQQSASGGADLGSAAKTILSGLANSLTSGGQQAASTQTTGTNAQSLASTVPTAPAAYNTAAQQSGAAVGNTQSLASTVPTVPSSYNTGAQQNMAASSNGAGAASSVNANNGVLSGTTYQSSGATSPLTPYNTAMDNSIGNMGKQLGSLISNHGQQSTNLQQSQQAPTIDAANSFQQPQLPANRDIVHLSIPQPNLAGAGSALGRRLQDAAGELSQPMQQSVQDNEKNTRTPGNILQATVGRLQNAAYSLANQLHGAGANAKTVSTQSAGAQPMAASTSQTAGAQESAPQWSTDPSVAQSGPAAGTAVGQQGATSAVAQPVAPSAFAPAAATSAADGQAGAATSAAAQPMAASALVPAAVSSAAPVHAAGINTAANPLTARTSASSTNGQVPLSATMISGTSADSVAEGMQRAMANTQRLVNGQTIQAASGMASSQQQAAAPAMAFGSSMAGSQQQAQAADPTMPQATAPAVTSTSGMAATQAQPATPAFPKQDVQTTSALPMAATTGSSGPLINAGRPTSAESALGGTTGLVVDLMNANGRRLSQVDEATLTAVATTVSKDPQVQATAAGVVYAAAAASGAYWIAAPADTAAAQQVMKLAAADPATIAAAVKLQAAVTASVKANYGNAVPASITSTASSLSIADLLQNPNVQGQSVLLIQASAAATGALWAAVAQGDAAAAQAVVKKSIADPATLAAAQKLAEVVLSQAAVQSFGHSLGSLFAGRRLLDAQKADGSLQSIVHNAVNDPSTQAAFAHVMEAAATETKALIDLSGPTAAPAPESATALTALQQLVSSVSHNALASALPGQPPSSQQQFSDWERSLSAPSAQLAKQQAAAQDAQAVQGSFDPAAAGKGLAHTLDQAASSVLLGIGRRHLLQAQAQQPVDLNPAVKALQQVGSGLQAAGQAAGQAVGLTPAKLQAAGAQLQVGTQAALIDAAKHVVRTIGVDSNLPNTATPGSEYGYNPISGVVPYSSATATAPAAIPGATQVSSAASAGALVDTTAAQQADAGTGVLTVGRRLQADEAQMQAQTSEQTANAVKGLIAGVSSLANVVRTALAPAGAAPASAATTTAAPATQQTVPVTAQQTVQVPQTQAMASTTPVQPVATQQAAVNPSANLQTQGGASNSAGSSSGGHVGITQASTFAGENGNQLSTNDIHLDNSKSNFVIGPDGKVPSLASMGGAATVAQQQGLLVPNGAAGSQSLSPSPGSFGSGNGAAPVYGSSASTNSPSYGSSTSSYSPPAYGSSGNSATPSYGASSGTPTYGSSGSTYSPVASSGSSASSVPGTVTTYNNGQTSGSTQQSNASGSALQSNGSGPSIQRTQSDASTQYQPQQGARATASFQRAVAPAPIRA